MPAITPQQAESEARAAFVEAWEDETAISFDNADFDPKGLKEYARFSWQDTGGSQASLGAREDGILYRRVGIAFVQIFTELNTGTARSNALKERALDFFETYLGAVWFRNQGPGYAGPGGGFYQVNVSAEFQYDSLRTG